MIHARNAFALSLGNNVLQVYLVDRPHLVKHDWNNKRHSNANYELHLNLRGECSLEVAEQRFCLSDRQAVLIAPGKYHQAKSVPGEVEHLTLSFCVPDGSVRASLMERVPVYRMCSLSQEMAGLCQSILYESSAEYAFRTEMMQAQVTQLLLIVFREMGITTRKSSPSGQDIVRIMRTETIDSFFEGNFGESVVEEDLAKELHLSRRQLGRVLQEYYGMGFREKLRMARMDRAAWFLRTTDKKICEIVGLVGYTSEAAFFQVFRRTYDMTPQQYRNRFLSTSGMQKIE